MLCKLCGLKESFEEELCDDCEKQWDEDIDRVDALVSQGHTRHCACRQVWGDGECERGRMPFTTGRRART